MQLNTMVIILRRLIAFYVNNSERKKILLLLVEQLCLAILNAGFALIVGIAFFSLALVTGIILLMTMGNNNKLTQYKGH
jgi:hypothetical protein